MSSDNGGNYAEGGKRGLSSDELEKIAARRKARRQEIERQTELNEEILAERHSARQSNDHDKLRRLDEADQVAAEVERDRSNDFTGSEAYMPAYREIVAQETGAPNDFDDPDDIRSVVQAHIAALKRRRDGKFLPEDVLVPNASAAKSVPSGQASIHKNALSGGEAAIAPPPQLSSFRDKAARERYELFYYNATPETQKQIQDEAKAYRARYGAGGNDNGLRISLMSSLSMDPKNVRYFPIHSPKPPQSTSPTVPKPPRM